MAGRGGSGRGADGAHARSTDLHAEPVRTALAGQLRLQRAARKNARILGAIRSRNLRPLNVP